MIGLKRDFWIIGLALFCLSNFTPLYAQTPTPSPTPSATPLADPEGCQTPPEDYTRVTIRSSVLSQRTMAMLAHAQTLYDGSLDLTNSAITQGSYNAGGVALSFGTHDGGGAVDISVRNIPIDWSIRWDDIEPLIEALRRAGFAAWYRDESDGMTPHIHAIAIGDADLSRAAALQLTGRYGYFRGYDGLPQANGQPQADKHGGFILCQWMLDLGYSDLRPETVQYEPPYSVQLGDNLYVNTQWGDELNLRAEPTTRAAIIRRMPQETQVTLLDGPRSADGYRWWLLRTEDGEVGWAVEAINGALMLVP